MSSPFFSSNFIKDLKSSLPIGKLGFDTITMTLGLGTRTIAQTLIFLIVAHVVGVEGYGAFAAVMALASALGSFVGFGSQVLLMKNVARDEETYTNSWSRALTSLAISIPIIALVYLVISFLLLPPNISDYVILAIGIGELIFAPLTVCVTSTYRGFERIGKASHLLVMPAMVRLFAALLLLLLSYYIPTTEFLNVWASFFVVSQILTTAYALRLLKHDLGIPVFFQWNQFFSTFREGFSFSFSVVALRLYADIDKSMLARMTTLEITGLYSVAYRIVDIATLPVIALFQSAQARFFRAGDGGVFGATSYALKIFNIPLLYALLISILLFFTSDLLPFILGQKYAGAVEILRLLALLPIVSLIRIFLQTSLLSGGYQHIAVLIFSIGALLNIILNIWFIPLMSWKGAVIATYIAEGLMVTIMLITLGLNALTKTSGKYRNL